LDIASRLTIAQNEKTLTVEGHYIHGRAGSPLVEPRNTVLYPLDGRTETSKVAIAFANAGVLFRTVPGEVTCQWKDSTLVSTIVVSVPEENAARRYEQTMSLNPAGELVVDIQLVGTPHGVTLLYQKRSRNPG
jgi:hypothetical protein